MAYRGIVAEAELLGHLQFLTFVQGKEFCSVKEFFCNIYCSSVHLFISIEYLITQGAGNVGKRLYLSGNKLEIIMCVLEKAFPFYGMVPVAIPAAIQTMLASAIPQSK